MRQIVTWKQRWSLIAVVWTLLTGLGLAVSWLFQPQVLITKRPDDRNLAIARAEACNMAIVCLIQENGRQDAFAKWRLARNDQERYELIRRYLAHAPAKWDDFLPGDFFQIELPSDIDRLSKVPLFVRERF